MIRIFIRIYDLPAQGSHCDTLSLTFPANEDIENFQMSVSLIFQFKESQFLLRIVAEYIGDVIFV